MQVIWDFIFKPGVLITVQFFLFFNYTSCKFRPEPDEDYTYGKNKPCLRYQLSNRNEIQVFSFDSLFSIDCRIKSDITYVKLEHSYDKPYCRLEACPEILDRILVSMNSPGRLIVDYSKCVQDHRLPTVKITIGSHNVDEVIFWGNYFYSSDTISSSSGKLTLALKYRGDGFNVVCKVPIIRLENSLFGEGFIVSGISDSVEVGLYSGNSLSKFDLRGLSYRSLFCGLYGEGQPVSYAGAPTKIFYSMKNNCVPLLYRGNPIIENLDDYCETVKHE